MKRTDYDPGDPETWPPYSGHPLDPRAPDETEGIEMLADEIRDDPNQIADAMDAFMLQHDTVILAVLLQQLINCKTGDGVVVAAGQIAAHVENVIMWHAGQRLGELDERDE